MITIEELLKQRETMITYLFSKAKQEDWHGVADAAMDLREIDAKVVILKESFSSDLHVEKYLK
jgi:hypothetical protein